MIRKTKSIFIKLLLIFIVTAVNIYSNDINNDDEGKNTDRLAKRIDAGVFFKQKEQTLYRISPDGMHIAYIGIKNNRKNIFINNIGETSGISITESENDIDNLSWGNNDYILYLQDNKGDENQRLYRVNIYNKEVKCLTNYNNVKTHIINNPQSKDGNIVVEMNLRDVKIFDPYSLNIITGEHKILYKNPGNVSGWMVDNSGTIRFARSNALLYRKDNDSEFKEIRKLASDDVFIPKFFTSRNEHVYAYSNLNRDKTAIVEFDPDTGKEIKVLFENNQYDAFGDDERDCFSYSQCKNKLLYALFTAEKRTLYFFDKTIEKNYKAIKNKIGKNYEINIVSNSEDLTKYIVKVSSDKVEGRYFFYDSETNNLFKLSEDSPWLDENEMAVMKPISSIARDGLEIHGYLTIPKGKKEKDLPVIVNPHAGPQWRNSWIFDRQIQFLANRGYAILNVNFRGSTGYGKTFLRKGYRQWGLKMLDDITDGVNWMIKKGIADKNRIAVWGWSFGGYSALAGVTLTPELYKCGIDLWGMSNLFSFYKSFPPYWNINQINERWIDISKDSVQMYKTSPVFHAKNIKAPLLIIQGANDIRVKKGQSDEMVEALKNNNKEVEYILMNEMGHGTAEDSTILKLMERIEVFLSKHMKADKQKTQTNIF